MLQRNRIQQCWLKKLSYICLLSAGIFFSASNRYEIKLAVLVYKGGGDWYANPTALPNLAKFCNEHLGTRIDPVYDEVAVGGKAIFNYPFVYLTGHGNIVLNYQEKENLVSYLTNGGFLHVDDNYGLDQYIRPILNSLFPNHSLQELSDDYPLYTIHFPFNNGMPKIHEHDALPPQAFGLFHEGRLVVLYTYEVDLGNGWEDEAVHNDPPEKRLEALQMGANIIKYCFTQ